ncbi:PREDICTED: internal alternative NAD(P)H-ubiquinone oxidoreductase A1, mitochondrial-like isoform X1 [Priapulus caudatus]|uniref:Internal alternative NAD(P)H-ubiquinone oxidoreductase A1, mitochondrial-like isoform X1 n=1 Tax=Priapulus caudatus TaxID=37621 RepID=A0ABM1DYD0_PRICU|nr:PREDICTED: internal alternative NAD(P)H-ubiquinone oxidoreductase A1, mitochondrial-like isoform X1 [Priapulus caudatus]XP_014664952.1 PREDICTED: internal alternative NAD(P)H-ubiquinone oxidoreductase A1, mitochondrial-like isoform X1 [Priapulus caudatus]
MMRKQGLSTLAIRMSGSMSGSYAEATTQRPQLVILGTGWGSYSVLRHIDKSMYDVVVVSPRNHFLFTPLLASTTVGTLEFRSVIEPVRDTIFRNAHHFHLAKAVSLDMANKIVKCQSTLSDNAYDISYDKLVIGVGAVANTFNIPGVEEHAIFLKEISDARKIRNRILANFEMALEPGIRTAEQKRLLSTVIVGGGPTGVEFGAELYDFVRQDVSRLYGEQAKQVNVTLIEASQILSMFDARLRKYAEKKIRERDRFNLLQAVVAEVRKDGVILKDGSEIPCGLVVWSTGIAQRKFTKALSVPKNKQEQILVDNYLRLTGDSTGDVYAIGDCSDIEGLHLPCTAQVAERQGRYLAGSLCKTPEKVSPFKFKNMGMLTYIGGYRALTDTPEAKLKGVMSWVLWRSAYLTRLGSWKLRLQVPMDWIKALFYGRDTSRFE